MLKTKNYIGNKFIDTTKKHLFDVINPYTQNLIVKVTDSTREDCQIAIDHAHMAFNGEWFYWNPIVIFSNILIIQIATTEIPVQSE